MKDTKAAGVRRESKKQQPQLSVKDEKAKKRRARKERKANKDPNKPKRAPTAFFIYLEEFRKIYKEQHPKAKTVSEVAKACGEKWKEMSPEDKAPYEAQAAKKKAEYEKAMATYNSKNLNPSNNTEKLEESKSDVDEEEDEEEEEEE